MIVYFEATAAELDHSDPSELEHLYSELLRASLRGNHYILIERRTCEWALTNLQLSGRDRAHLEGLKQGFTQRGAVRRNATCELVVGVSAAGLERIALHRFQIGHKSLLRGNFLDEPILLVENSENDGRFLKLAIEAAQNPIKDLTYTVRHGGGSTVVTCFDHEVRHNRIVVCVVDSDQISPHCPPSGTVRALSRTAELAGFIGNIFTTQCREVENYIPLDIIRDHHLCPIYSDFGAHDAIRAREVQENIYDSHWLYFDIKKGMVGRTLLSKQRSGKVEAWLKARYESHHTPFEEVQVAGFGENLLSTFLDSGPSLGSFHSHMRSHFWQQAFKAFFHDISWYFVADKRKSVT